jgi:hypothetical protein
MVSTLQVCWLNSSKHLGYFSKAWQMCRPSQSPWRNHFYIWLKLQVMELLIVEFSSCSCYFLPVLQLWRITPLGLFQFTVSTFGRTPLPCDQAYSRLLPTHDWITQEDADRHVLYLEWDSIPRSQCPSDQGWRPRPCLLPLGSKYSPQHPVLKHPLSVFPLVWETKFHTRAKQQVKT